MKKTEASTGVETLFTSALGLQSPWEVVKVELDTSRRRIDFNVLCNAKRLACPACGLAEQGIHDRRHLSWRHLDFFQFEAWLHADVPRVHCSGCGKTTQASVPWARAGSGFTALFEALALSLCAQMPVRQAAAMLRCSDKQLWRRIEHYVEQARTLDDMSDVRSIGIDETSLRKGHNYITVVHDLDAKRLLFATEGREHATVQAFVQDLQAHGGQATQIEHVCQDMSAAYLKGVRETLPQAVISFDRFHVVALANKAMDEVRKDELRQTPQAVAQALDNDTQARKGLGWGMRKNPDGWTQTQATAMHWLQRSNLKAASAWRMKMGLREVYAKAQIHNDSLQAYNDLQRWLGWARRSRLKPFMRLAGTITAHLAGVVNGMLGKRTNAYVEAMNGLLQQVKRAARGFRTAKNFIAIAHLRMGRLKHLPANPLQGASARIAGQGC
ncbi:ISL3-like element ISMac21 family transposase [Melaminivora sp.]|jgi:transposase